jgi:hypothetical protein
MILAKEQESQMPKKVEFNTATALSLAFKIFDKQGYVKTGHYYSSDEKIRPNKEVLSAELEKNPFDVIHPSVEKLSDMQKDLFFKKMASSVTDYEDLISRLLTNKKIGIKDLGLVASIPLMYNNYIKAKKKQEKYCYYQDHSSFIGQPGEKFALEVSVIENTFLSYKGFYIYAFEDANSNVIKWMTGKEIEFKIGEKITLTGTIKAHNQTKYYGAETLVTRCKVVK